MRLAVAIAVSVISIRGLRAAEATLGRLGHDVVPVSESIALELDPRQADYAGSVDVVVDVRVAVRSFRFHARELDLRKLNLTPSLPGSTATPLTAEAIADGQVEARSALPIPKGRYTLHIDFHNDFGTQANGLYRLQVAGEWYAFTQFEAIEARGAFPCWDEPAFKIPFRITLTVPKTDAAIANTEEAVAVEQEGKRAITFKPTRPLPSYLLAVATGPFEFVPIPGTSIPTRIVTTKGQTRLTGQAVAMTPPILAALERYFGSRYPYEKLDLIAVPEYWYGAMENPGAITFLDRVLLIDPKSVTDDEREHLAVDVAHELAHMWFGDLVTMAWWDDLWLNESFASWMEDKIVAEVFPEFNSVVGEVSSSQWVMERDTLLTTRAMRQPVRSMDSLLQSADALAYQKGSAILHMVEDWIGPDSFRSGVLAYLKEHADGNAVAGDLWSAFRKASGKNVEPSLASFLDQPGVPLVSVEPLPGGRVRLSQSRFVNAGAKPSGGQLWQIPVALRYPGDGGTTTQRVALTKASQVVTLKSKTTPLWIYPNAGESGYYRWSLAGASFEHLAAVAPSTLDVRERVGSLGNSEALLHAGRLAGTAYVKVLESFASDPDPQVALSVLGGLGTIRETFFAGSRDAEFAPYVRRTLTPMLERFGAEKRAGEAEPVTSLRPRLLATLGDAGRDEAVLAQMERLAAAYLADPSSVDPSLADTAIGLSAIRGDAALFDLYRARFEAARVPAERRRFLSALGNFRDPALSARALDYVFTGPLRPQEMLAIPRTQAAVPEAQARTLAWITSHYDQLAAKIPAEFMVFMPHFANGCSIAEVDTAKRFFTDPAHAPPGTSKELARVEESVGDCVSLDAREGASVRRYTTAGR